MNTEIISSEMAPEEDSLIVTQILTVTSGRQMKMRDYETMIKNSSLTDEDGFGFYATQRYVTNLTTYPSLISSRLHKRRRKIFSHIIWHKIAPRQQEFNEEEFLEMVDHEMHEEVICKHCGGYEYHGMMHWSNGKQMCRVCMYEEWKQRGLKVRPDWYTYPLYDDGVNYAEMQKED